MINGATVLTGYRQPAQLNAVSYTCWLKRVNFLHTALALPPAFGLVKKTKQKGNEGKVTAKSNNHARQSRHIYEDIYVYIYIALEYMYLRITRICSHIFSYMHIKFKYASRIFSSMRIEINCRTVPLPLPTVHPYPLSKWGLPRLPPNTQFIQQQLKFTVNNRNGKKPTKRNIFVNIFFCCLCFKYKAPNGIAKNK